MEAAGKMEFNIMPLKEPRGFIKVIQWILSIFAFATTTSMHTQIAFSATCPNTTEVVKRSTAISYNFHLEDYGFDLPLCNTSLPVGHVYLLQGAKSAAEFYVFVGVIVFLYCIAALVVYLLFDDFYRKNTYFTVGDFIGSIIIVLLWLISSSAWAQGVTDVKYYTDLVDCGFFRYVDECTSNDVVCSQTQMGNYASLNVSIIFGFLNMLVWVGNLWFLWKETPWYKVQSKPPTMPGQPDQETDPQKI